MKANIKKNLDTIIAEETAKLEAEDGGLKEKDPWANEELNRLVKAESEKTKDDIHLKTIIKHIHDAAEIFEFSKQYYNGNGPHYESTRIVKKLWDRIPLTPLTNTEDDWEPCPGSENEDSHKRAGYLLRAKGNDGNYTYSDERRILGLENGKTYYMGFLVDILNELEPITFPYEPNERPYYANTMSFNTEAFSKKLPTTKEKNALRRADGRRNSRVLYDTFGIFSITCPNGRVIPVGKYYRYDDGKKEEITYTEFLERKKIFDDKVEKALKKAAKKKESENGDGE